MHIVALHGFLGRPHDWRSLFQGTPLENFIVPIDLFQDSEVPSLRDWACAFNSYAAKAFSSRSRILLGYSMGGRLALHAVADQPHLWQAAIIISAHPGLSNAELKEQRRQLDFTWASRFKTEDWDSLMIQWGARSVFSGDSFHFERKERDYCRRTLSNCLETWSLSNQEDLRLQTSRLDLPVLWIAGEADISYAREAQGMTFKHPLSKVWIVPAAGHRVPWQLPELFMSELTSFLSQLK